MEILNWHDGTFTSNIIGTFDIYLGQKWGVTFKNFKLIFSKKGYPILAFPSYSIQGVGDKKTWIPYIELSPEKRETFTKEVMELVKPFAARRMALHKGGEF